MKCYCGRDNEFFQCCEPIINGKQKALTAEDLMRSRYCGYVAANVNYLLKSHHASTRPVKDKKGILKFAKSAKWISLSIINTKKGLADDTDGWVEFKAVYMENGHMNSIHENSYFKKENDEWFYVSGEYF